LNKPLFEDSGVDKMMTLAEKILAAHCGRKLVSAGEFINCRVDMVLSNDITAPIAIKEFRRLGVKVFDPQKIVMVPDHFVPNKDINSAEQAKILRDFARETGILYFDVGQMGIEHVILPEKGIVLPGDVVVGADSHTCTYGAIGAFATGMGSTDIAMAMATGDVWMKVPSTIKFNFHGQLRKWVSGKDLILYTIGQIGVDGALYASMEFDGEAIESLSMAGRFTIANMAIEAGGKAGLFKVDAKTLEYVNARAKRPYTVYAPDAGAQYAQAFDWDASKIEPQVSAPHLPSNTKPVSAFNQVAIDQAVIGSCTNGRLEDLQIAAQILKGRKVNPRVRCIVIPGSQQIYLEAMKEGLLEIFINAGAAVSTPTCGPCLGGYMGVLAAGEKAISTTNRNFVGRMGSTKSEVYLANPAVAAASAITGRIVSPQDLN
jgi:3-isopropylmalate/(R)-2-methylmalate dehydratase large subunit